MSQQTSAEAIQLEAREVSIKAALSVLDQGLQAFAPLMDEALCDHCQEFSGDRLRKVEGAIREAIAQLKGGQ